MPKEDEYTKVMWEAERSETNKTRVLEAAKTIAPDMKDSCSGRLGGYMRWSFQKVKGCGLFFDFCWDNAGKQNAVIPADMVIEMISEGLDKPLLLEFIDTGSVALSDEETAKYGRQLGETFNILSGKNEEGKKLAEFVNAIHNGHCKLVESQEKNNS